MRTHLVAVALLLTVCAWSQATPEPTRETSESELITMPEPPMEDGSDTNRVYTVVEKNAEFPGGQAAMMEYMSKNIHYPAAEREAFIQGRVFLKYVVRRDGSITDVRLVRGVDGGPGLAREAMRVVSGMPRWSPGELHGQKVNVEMTIPVIFKLQEP
jgi:protein TonB